MSADVSSQMVLTTQIVNTNTITLMKTEIKDGADIAFQQITLYLSIFNGVTRLSRCIVAANGCRCQGWSTVNLGAMVTVLIGEIIEMVKYEDITDTLEKEYDLAKFLISRYLC